MALVNKAAVGRLKGVVGESGAGKAMLGRGGALSRMVRAQNNEEIEAQLTAEELQAATIALSIVEGAFLVAASDGEVSDEEADKLTELTVELFDGGVTEHDVQLIAERVNEVLEQQGFEARIAEVAASLPSHDDRRVAFIAAAAMAYFDGAITEDEETVFSAYADALGISDDDADELLTHVQESMGVEIA